MSRIELTSSLSNSHVLLSKDEENAVAYINEALLTSSHHFEQDYDNKRIESIQTLISSYVDKRDNIQHLQESMAECERNNESLSNKLDKFKEDLEIAEDKIDDLEAKIINHENTIQHLDSKCDILEEKLAAHGAS